MWGLPLLRRFPAFGVKNTLYALPGLVVYDPQIGHIGHHPRLCGVDTSDALAGVRVLDHTLSVPHEAPDIEVLPQDSVRALARSVYRGCVPLRASRRRDALAIERCSDITWRPPIDRLIEDAADDI